MQLDVDICVTSKDRPLMVLKQIERIKRYLPYNKIIIVDSSEKPYSLPFDSDDDLIHIHTPDAKLGFARKCAVSKVSTPYFLVLDDDISFTHDITGKMLKRNMDDDRDFAVSPRISFGVRPSLVKIALVERANIPLGGCVLLDKEVLDMLGGYNPDIHYGEDNDVYLRAKKKGFNWVNEPDELVYHLNDPKGFVFRWFLPVDNCMNRLCSLTMHNLNLFRFYVRKIFRVIGKTPRVLLRTRDLKSGLYYGAQSLLDLASTTRGMIRYKGELENGEY